MRGRRIDDLGLFARQGVDHGHRLARGVVVQAQNYQVHLGHQVALGGGVFAQRRIDTDQLDASHAVQAFTNLQTGGASLAVDKNLVHNYFQQQARTWRRLVRG